MHPRVLHCATHPDCWDGLEGLERQIYHRKGIKRFSCPAQLPATDSSSLVPQEHDWVAAASSWDGTSLQCYPNSWAPPLEPLNLPHMGQALEISERCTKSLSASSVCHVHVESLPTSELRGPLWATAWADYTRKINLGHVVAWPWPEPEKVNVPITPACVCESAVNTNEGHWPSLSCSPRPGVWSFGLSAQALANKCPFLVHKGM